VGALGHYLESEGVPTTQISLIREHTEAIRPPRALWVPFDLGRPLGVPGNPGFQKRVLLAALTLLESSAGPVLEKFPDDAPAQDVGGEPDGWACPVLFASDMPQPPGEASFLTSLRREITELRPWYDLGLQRTRRTAVAYFQPEDALGLFSSIIRGEEPPLPRQISSLALALRLAAQDLKAFYFEAVASKPGLAPPGASQFQQWFWKQTAAGEILRKVKEIYSSASDKDLKLAARLFLVPLDQA